MKLLILNAFFFLVLAASALADPGNAGEAMRGPSLATNAPPITMPAAAAMIGATAIGLVFLAAVATRAASDPEWEFRKGPRVENALVPTMLLAFLVAVTIEDVRPEVADVMRGLRYGVVMGAAAFYSGIFLVAAVFRQTRKNLKNDLCPNAQPSPAT